MPLGPCECKLELMFMKHYAPNRCLYIKVAKLRTGVGSAEMSHLQNCSLKIYLKRAHGGGVGLVVGGGGGGQGGCERRFEVFVKIKKKKKKNFCGGVQGGGRVGFGGEGRVGGGGGQGGCERRIEVFVKIQKKKNWTGGGRGGGGWGGGVGFGGGGGFRVDVI